MEIKIKDKQKRYEAPAIEILVSPPFMNTATSQQADDSGDEGEKHGAKENLFDSGLSKSSLWDDEETETETETDNFMQ